MAVKLLISHKIGQIFSQNDKLIPFEARSIFKYNCDKSDVTNEQIVVGLPDYIYGASRRSTARSPVSQIIYNLALKDLNARVA